MAVAYLLAGTNIGNKTNNLIRALNLIEQSGLTLIKKSSIYESSPWGFNHPESFYNQAFGIRTDLLPEFLLSTLLDIEKQMGRIRTTGQYEARIIDLDILFYDDLQLQTLSLSLPHPLLHLRRFALEPLCEIAPSIIHPIFNKTVRVLLQECTDTGSVTRI